MVQLLSVHIFGPTAFVNLAPALLCHNLDLKPNLKRCTAMKIYPSILIANFTKALHCLAKQGIF